MQPLKAPCTTCARLLLITRCELARDAGTREPSVDAEIPTNKPCPFYCSSVVYFLGGLFYFATCWITFALPTQGKRLIADLLVAGCKELCLSRSEVSFPLLFLSGPCVFFPYFFLVVSCFRFSISSGVGSLICVRWIFQSTKN